MGYKTSDYVKVILCDEKYWVLANKKLPVGRLRAYRELLAEIPEDMKMPEIEKNKALLVASIVEWNLDAEDGSIMPIDMDHLNELDVEDQKLIFDQVKGSRNTRNVQEEALFLLPPTPGSEEPAVPVPPSDMKTSSAPDSSGAILEFPTIGETVMNGTTKSSKSGSNSSV